MIAETYRGVKLKVQALKGQHWGYVRCTVGGQPFGVWIGTEENQLESLRRGVDAAIARPEAYDPQWLPS